MLSWFLKLSANNFINLLSIQFFILIRFHPLKNQLIVSFILINDFSNLIYLKKSIENVKNFIYKYDDPETVNYLYCLQSSINTLITKGATFQIYHLLSIQINNMPKIELISSI